MAKTVNDIVEGYCKKGLPPAKKSSITQDSDGSLSLI